MSQAPVSEHLKNGYYARLFFVMRLGSIVIYLIYSGGKLRIWKEFRECPVNKIQLINGANSVLWCGAISLAQKFYLHE